VYTNRCANNVPRLYGKHYSHGLRTNKVHVLATDRLSGMQVYVRDFGRMRANRPSLFCIHDIKTEDQLIELNEYVDSVISDQ
jgi:hypothetical protein